MKTLLILAVVLVGGWYALKIFKRESARVQQKLDAARRRPSETLERDAKTGRYTLKDKE
jgi:hypothetical protein